MVLITTSSAGLSRYDGKADSMLFIGIFLPFKKPF